MKCSSMTHGREMQEQKHETLEDDVIYDPAQLEMLQGRTYQQEGRELQEHQGEALDDDLTH